jgi:hypothetical protein
MSQRVSISTASPLVALVIRKTLARSRYLGPPTDHRAAQAALASLREPTSLAIVDAELLYEGEAGAALHKELIARRAPSIVIDARGRGVPDGVAATPSIVVLRGRLRDELDLAVIETHLLAAVGTVVRLRNRLGSKTQIGPSIVRTGPSDDILELVVLGVSTGGPPLLMRLLKDLTKPAIPLLIVQHMPESETAGFAQRLSEESGLVVREMAAGPIACGRLARRAPRGR